MRRSGYIGPYARRFGTPGGGKLQFGQFRFGEPEHLRRVITMSKLLTQQFKEKLEDLVESYELKLYVEDDNGEWVDLSDRVAARGKNLLISVGQIAQTTESRAGTGSFETSIARIQVDNSDHFWDQPWSGLTTINGNSASFGDSTQYQFTALFRRRVKLAMRLRLRDGTEEEGDLGVGYIDDLQTDSNSGTAALSVIGIARYLMELSADKVKGGRSWYRNRPVAFLVRELLKQAFANDYGQLPDTYVLPEDTLEMPSYRPGATDPRVLGQYGRPPEYDGVVWIDSDYICRAVAFANDANIKKLYLGCDEHLYEYDPDTGIYRRLTSTVSELGTNYYIRHLWYNPNFNHSEKYIWGIAWPDASDGDFSVDAKIFSYGPNDGVTVERTSSEDGALGELFCSYFCYRDGRQAGGQRVIGYAANGDTAGENVPVIFDHYVTGWGAGAEGQSASAYDAQGATGGDPAQDFDLPGMTSDTPNGSAHYYAFYYGGSTNAYIRFTLGQQGAVFFQPNYDGGASAKGAIVFPRWNSTSDRLEWWYYEIEDNDCYEMEHFRNWVGATLTVDSDYTGKQWPTCGAAHETADDHFYLGMVQWVEVAHSTPGTIGDAQRSRAMLYKCSISDNLGEFEATLGEDEDGSHDYVYVYEGTSTFDIGDRVRIGPSSHPDNSGQKVYKTVVDIQTVTGGYKVVLDSATGYKFNTDDAKNDSDNKFRTFIDMVHHSADSRVYLVTLQRDKVGTGEACAFGYHEDSTKSDSVTDKRTSFNLFRRLVVAGSDDDNDIYFVETGRACLMRYDSSAVRPRCLLWTKEIR